MARNEGVEDRMSFLRKEDRERVPGLDRAFGMKFIPLPAAAIRAN